MKFLIQLIIVINYVKGCSEEGTYVLKIKFHLDELTHRMISNIEKIKGRFNNEKGSHEIVTAYLNTVLNEINADLEDHGVQIIGDYDYLLFEELGINLNKDKLCTSKFMVVEATAAMLPKLLYPKTDGLGLRIVALSCPVFNLTQIPQFSISNGSCGNLGTISVIEPFTLKLSIKSLVKSFISEKVGSVYPIKSKSYKKHLCQFVNKCAVKNNQIGKFLHHLAKVEYTPNKMTSNYRYRHNKYI
jgi:hypothetical protein